jgi:hypothetical protein
MKGRGERPAVSGAQAWRVGFAAVPGARAWRAGLAALPGARARSAVLAAVAIVPIAAGPARASAPEDRTSPGTAVQTPDPEAVAREARRLLARFRHEPSVLEAQEAAVRHAGIDAARLASWRERSRWSAAAPEFLAEYRRAAGTDRTLGAQSSGTVDYADLDLEDRYTVRARWDLDRLVFNPDELRVASETIEVVELRQAVIDQVTRLYFERRRQQVLLLRSALEVDERLRLELRVEELTASLDGLTGGWFSARLRSTGGETGGRWEGTEAIGKRRDGRSADPVSGRSAGFDEEAGRRGSGESFRPERDHRDTAGFGPTGGPWFPGRAVGGEE